jgi:hypothetical protein
MGGNSSKDKKEVQELRAHCSELEARLTNLASLAVPNWRAGDRKYYDIHEAAWQRIQQQNQRHAPRPQAAPGHPPAHAELPHPSEVQLGLGAPGDSSLSFDNSTPYGDDLMLTVLLLLRKTPQLTTLSMVNSGLTDRGADLLAAVLRPNPSDTGVRIPALRLLLAGNPALSAFGARRLMSAVALYPADACVGGALDLSGCNSIYAGSTDDVAGVEQLTEQIGKLHGFALTLPPRPEAPFYVEGATIRLSDFQSAGAEFRPIQAGNSPLWLHREDIKMKSDAKADGLYQFLCELVDKQSRSRQRTDPNVKPYEAGYNYLAPVRYAAIRAKVTVVAVVDAIQGKTYAELIKDSEQSGLKLTRALKLQIFFQVAAAVAFSHQHNFAMRSLRPDLLIVHLDHGRANCYYIDYCALRPESLRSTKVQLGCRMIFTDPSVRAGASVSRSMDAYAVAMMVVYAYAFTDVLDDFKAKQYTWLNDQIRPVHDQLPDALAHYTALGLEPDVATLVVGLTRTDDQRITCAAAAKSFFELATAEETAHK